MTDFIEVKPCAVSELVGNGNKYSPLFIGFSPNHAPLPVHTVLAMTEYFLDDNVRNPRSFTYSGASLAIQLALFFKDALNVENPIIYTKREFLNILNYRILRQCAGYSSSIPVEVLGLDVGLHKIWAYAYTFKVIDLGIRPIRGNVLIYNTKRAYIKALSEDYSKTAPWLTQPFKDKFLSKAMYIA